MAGPSRTVRQRRLARQLRQFREDASLTIEQVGKALEISASTVSRIETAQVGVRPRDLRDLLELYGITGTQREELLKIARERHQQPWWQEYKGVPNFTLAGLEADASSIWHYSSLLVPGLLQTSAYAGAVLGAIRRDVKPHDIERRLSLRLDRQKLLRRESAPEYWVILDEAVLRRHVGGRQTMHEQLEHLVKVAKLPTVTLQVLPFASGEHAGMDGAFTIVRYDKPEDPDVVYIESPAGEVYVERPDVVRQCSLIFDHLRAAAQNPGESIRTLTYFQSQLQELKGADHGPVAPGLAQEHPQ